MRKNLCLEGERIQNSIRNRKMLAKIRSSACKVITGISVTAVWNHMYVQEQLRIKRNERRGGQRAKYVEGEGRI